MDQLITTTHSLEENGRKIYKQNRHYRKLANLMEHPEFREFYNEYMKDLEDAKVVLMFMKLYDEIEKHATTPLTPFEKISIMKNIIDNGETRHRLCNGWERSLNFGEEKSIIRKSS